MTERENLSSEQLELLLDHRRMKREDKSPVLVSGQAVNAVREVLGASLRERGVSDPDSLTLEALAGQFTTLEQEELEETVTALGKQMPATGGQPAEESEPAEEVGAAERNEAREKLEKASKVESRLPRRCEALRNEAAELLGVESHEEIDLETL